MEDLIVQDSHCWNFALVHDTFGDEVGQMITHIPLDPNLLVDKFVWNENSNGNFTVKSAYHKARTMIGNPPTTPSYECDMSKTIWAAEVMPKVKHFM